MTLDDPKLSASQSELLVAICPTISNISDPHRHPASKSLSSADASVPVSDCDGFIDGILASGITYVSKVTVVTESISTASHCCGSMDIYIYIYTLIHMYILYIYIYSNEILDMLAVLAPNLCSEMFKEPWILSLKRNMVDLVSRHAFTWSQLMPLRSFSNSTATSSSERGFSAARPGERL